MYSAADLPIGEQGEERSTWLSQYALTGILSRFTGTART